MAPNLDILPPPNATIICNVFVDFAFDFFFLEARASHVTESQVQSHFIRSVFCKALYIPVYGIVLHGPVRSLKVSYCSL